MWVVRCSGHIVKSMASDINTGKAPCSNTAAAIDCLSPLVAIRLCDSLETAQPMLNTTLAIHLTSKKVDAFASVTHRLIQGYRFRVGPYRFCGASNPTTHSILLWSYLILSDAHINITILGISSQLMTKILVVILLPKVLILGDCDHAICAWQTSSLDLLHDNQRGLF